MEKIDAKQNAQTQGTYILQQFQQRLAEIKGIVSIRGKGMMIGIELDRPCPELVSLALQEKLLINVASQNVIRLLPPLIFTSEQADSLVNTLCHIIESFLSE